MSTKIGFNNFKAFGSQMQYFTKKPITLIYGPNSVGKSSLLHSQLLLAYLRNYISNFDIHTTSFAGDEIDFGGFENFIHKHDTTKDISFEIVFSDEDDLNRLLTPKYSEIMELKNNGFFDREITTEEIDVKLESVYKESAIKLKHLISYISVAREISREETYDDSNELIEVLDEVQSIHYKLAFNEYFQNTKNESPTEQDRDNFISLFDTQLDKLQNNCDDILITAILLTEHYESKHIVARLKFFKYLSSIQTIKFNIEINTKASVICFINEVKLFEIQNTSHFLDKTEKPSINDEHEALQEYKIITQVQRPIQIYKNFFGKYNDFDFSLNNLMGEFFNLKKNFNQYFGPLRHYPERFELYSIDGVEEKNASFLTKLSHSIMGSKFYSILLASLAIVIILIYTIFFRERSFFEIDPLGTIIALVFLSIVVSGIYTQLSKDDFGKDRLNSILPKRFGLLRDKVISSYDAWKILFNSNDTVNKLNKWLGDNSKLKSNYSIKVVKKPITYFDILVRQIAKILNVEKAYFDYLYSDNNKTSKFWSNIEKRLNIQQRYESQLLFTDLAKNTEVTPRDMGLGISQILPILISTFSSKESTLYLEQPELHLHPAVQMELMDEFIRSHNENSNEFMMESHSEHMLLRVMKRLRQTADGTLDDESLRLTPDDVCLLYVDNDGEQTYLRELRFSKAGKLLDHWPNGFFEEGYKERFL